MTKNENERLAVVENELSHVKGDVNEIVEIVKELRADRKEDRAAIDKLNGRWGLLFMISSAILSVIVFFKSAIIDMMKGLSLL